MNEKQYPTASLEVVQKFAPKNHSVSIKTVGWGEPPSYYSSCSCGWNGRIIETDDERKPENFFIESLIPYLEKYTFEILLGENEIYGNEYTAIREVLEHLQLDYVKLRANAKKKLNDKKEQLLGDVHEWTPLELRELADDIENLAALGELQNFNENFPLGERRTPFNAEIYETQNRLLDEYYAAMQEKNLALLEERENKLD